MDKIRFCPGRKGVFSDLYHKVPDDEESCELCTAYYRADDVDAHLLKVRRLVTAANNLLSMAESEGWDKATTGRQILVRDIKQAIAEI